MFGKPLRGDNTTPRQVLYRRSRAQYVDVGHQHRVRVDGTSASLSTPILHDDRKPLSRWLGSQDRYLTIEAAKLSATAYADLDLNDKIRKTKILSPFAVFMYLPAAPRPDPRRLARLALPRCSAPSWRPSSRSG